MNTQQADKVWIDNDGSFLFGKHRGEQVSRVDSKYLFWILDQVDDICNEDREIIKLALNRRGLDASSY